MIVELAKFNSGPKGEKIMTKSIITTFTPRAKTTGDISKLRREALAALFGSARNSLHQAMPANLTTLGSLSAWSSHTAPANAIGFIRHALSPERFSLGVQKTQAVVLLNTKNLIETV